MNCVKAYRVAGCDIAVCDAARLECLVKPFRDRAESVISSYDAFFESPGLRVLPVTAAVWREAARIRADYRFGALDSLHLAAAVEHGCSMFLTNDEALRRFTGIPVLPVP